MDSMATYTLPNSVTPGAGGGGGGAEPPPMRGRSMSGSAAPIMQVAGGVASAPNSPPGTAGFLVRPGSQQPNVQPNTYQPANYAGAAAYAPAQGTYGQAMSGAQAAYTYGRSPAPGRLETVTASDANDRLEDITASETYDDRSRRVRSDDDSELGQAALRGYN